MPQLKPFLKWAGGKSQLIGDIQARLPNYTANQDFCMIEPFLGGPRGLLRPVIDAAALRSGVSQTFCTSAAPTDIASGSIDAKAWVITAMDQCGGGLLISTTAIGWIVGVTALLVGVSLFVSDICGRAPGARDQIVREHGHRAGAAS